MNRELNPGLYVILLQVTSAISNHTWMNLTVEMTRDQNKIGKLKNWIVEKLENWESGKLES